MTEPTYSSSASVQRVAIAWPEGRLVRRAVKEVQGVDAYPSEVHPGKKHRWHEMLHYGQPGTGYVSCRCGAIGVPYRPL